MDLKTVMALAIAAAFAAPVAAQTSSGSDKPAGAQSSGTSAERPAAGATASGGFAGLDKDNDGRLSRSEFDAMQGAAGATGSDKPGQKQ